MLMLSEEEWLERMENECRKLNREGFEGEVSPDYRKFIITIRANGFEPSSPGNPPRKRNIHNVQIEVSRNYPYDVPKTRWLTPIFHPNITPPPPIGKGEVCMEMLNVGSVRNLAELVMGLVVLVKNPNPTSPMPHPTCYEAKEFFERHSDITKQMEGPRIVGVGRDTSTGSSPRIVSGLEDRAKITG